MAKRVVLMWCSSHSNIYGNEQADKAASSGARTPPPLNPITPYQDLKAETHKILTKDLKEWPNLDMVTSWKGPTPLQSAAELNTYISVDYAIIRSYTKHKVFL
jgi:hypothetical protein